MPKKHKKTKAVVSKKVRNFIAYSDYALKQCPNLKVTYEHRITAFRENRLREVAFEKLKGHALFTIELNRSDRLLMVRIKINDIKINDLWYYLVIDVILDHKHHKSIFFNPSVLKAYMDNKSDAFDAEAPLTFEAHDGTGLEQNPDDAEQVEIDPESISFYNEMAVLTSKQLQALNSAYPVVVIGPAGTGKTNVGFESLLRSVLSSKTHEFIMVWYVTKSRILTHTLANKFATHPFFVEIKKRGNARVQFIPHNKLRGFAPDPSPFEKELKEEKTTIDEEKKLFSPIAQKQCFLDWFKHFQHKHRQLVKTLKVPALDAKLLKSPEFIYNEFGLIAAYKSDQIEKRYVLEGENSSNFKDQNVRQVVYTAFLEYKKDHPEDQILFPLKEENPERCDLLFLDEGHEFNPIEMKWILRNKVKNNQAMVFYSHDQYEDGLLANRQFLSELMPRAEFIQLPHNFRNPSDVTQFVNDVTQLKVKLAGNSDKQAFHPLPKEVPKKAGFIHWVKLKDGFDYSKYANQIVITLEEFVKEADGLFPNATVLTAKQARGLEFEEVVLYRMLDEKGHKLAAEILDTTDVETLSEHRSKVGGNEEINPAFNRFITGLTRGTKLDTIIQTEYHYLKSLITYFKSKLPKYSYEEAAVTPQPKSRAQLLADAKELYLGGYVQKSQGILEGLGEKASNLFGVWREERMESAPESFDFPASETKQESPLAEEKKNKLVPKKATRDHVDTNPTKANLKKIVDQPKAREWAGDKLVDDKAYKLIDSLLNDFTEAQLMNCFDHKNAIVLVLKRMDVILQNPLWTNIFVHFLMSHEKARRLFRVEFLSKMIEVENGVNMPLFYILLANDTHFIEERFQLFDQLPVQQYADMPSEALYAVNSEGMSLMLVLSLYRPGYVKDLLLANPMLMQQMTSVIFYSEALDNFEAFFKCSIFRALAQTAVGCEVILMFLKNSLTDDSFYVSKLHQACPEAEKLTEKATTLQILASTEQGRRVLSEYLTEYPSLKKLITPDMWNYIPMASHLKQSAQFYISNASLAEEIVRLLPEFFGAKLQAYIPTTEVHGVDSPVAKTYIGFCKNPTAENLTKILTHHKADRWLFEPFETDTITTTLLIAILKEPSKINLLYQVVSKMPALLKLFTAKRLSELNQLRGRPALYWMTLAPLSIKILLRLDPSTISKITEESFLLEYEKDSVLDQLIRSRDENSHLFFLGVLKNNKPIFQQMLRQINLNGPFSNNLKEILEQTVSGRGALYLLTEGEQPSDLDEIDQLEREGLHNVPGLFDNIVEYFDPSKNDGHIQKILGLASCFNVSSSPTCGVRATQNARFYKEEKSNPTRTAKARSSHPSNSKQTKETVADDLSAQQEGPSR